MRIVVEALWSKLFNWLLRLQVCGWSFIFDTYSLSNPKCRRNYINRFCFRTFEQECERLLLSLVVDKGVWSFTLTRYVKLSPSYMWSFPPSRVCDALTLHKHVKLPPFKGVWGFPLSRVYVAFPFQGCVKLYLHSLILHKGSWS